MSLRADLPNASPESHCAFVQSPLSSPPLTRFDAVMWFLRVQLWLLVVTGVFQLLTSIVYLFSSFRSPVFLIQFVGSHAVPILILMLFPAVLASSALGPTARDSVVSLADVKPLTGRCIGLTLFISSLGYIVLFAASVAYALATHDSSFGFGTSTSRWFQLSPLIQPIISIFLGFALAFGPNIRDSFRSR